MDGKGVQKDDVRALAWFDLAAQSAKACAIGQAQNCTAAETCILSDNRKCSPAKSRDKLKKHLSKAEITNAEQMIKRCKESNYQQCD
jgi:hypothetical protein